MDCLYAVVSAKQCQELRLILRTRRLLNPDVQCFKLDGNVGIPVLRDVLQLVTQDGKSCVLDDVPFQVVHKMIDKPRSKTVPKSESLRMVVQSVMCSKGLWDDGLQAEVPTCWEKYGDMLMFNADKYLRSEVWREAGADLWQSVMQVLNGQRIALKSHISPDGFRTPRVELLWGTCTWVDTMDNGIRYGWDVTKNMFCAGNAPERHRVANLNCKGQVVVDLYAGIGYFTLPYLVHAGAQLVHACEWNPDAVAALRKNLLANNISERCVVHEGDNREVELFAVADRVNLGLLPSSEPGWRVACRTLKLTGGILHVHGNVTSGMNKTVIGCKKPEWTQWGEHVSRSIHSILLHEHPEICWQVLVLNLYRVKSYAPHIDHLVLDLGCYRMGEQL